MKGFLTLMNTGDALGTVMVALSFQKTALFKITGSKIKLFGTFFVIKMNSPKLP